MRFLRDLNLFIKITLLLVIIMAGAFLFFSRINYRLQEQYVVAEAVEKARLVAFEAIRTREYLSRQLQEGDVPLSLERYGLIPVVASQRIGSEVAADVDYRIRQVSSRYRNPQNAPDEFERRVLQQFVDDPQLQEQYAVTEVNGEQVFRYLQPFVADKSCLACHGAPEAAPAFIRKRIPEEQSYNYRVGEVIGAASVTIPMLRLEQQAASNQRQTLINLGLAFLVLVACLGMLLKVAVTAPLARLGGVINRIVATGRFEKPLAEKGRDEIGRLISGFNGMIENLQEKTAHLEESERRFRTLTETARDCIVSFLANGQIILFNSRAEQIFGYSKAEVFGLSVAQLVHEECTEFHAMGIEAYFAGHLGGLLRDIRVIPGRQRDGGLVRLELSLSAAESDGHHFYTAILREVAE